MRTISGVIKGGKITIETEGFVGPACVEATRAYLAKLGGDDGDAQHKPAYYEQEVQSEHAG